MVQTGLTNQKVIIEIVLITHTLVTAIQRPMRRRRTIPTTPLSRTSPTGIITLLTHLRLRIRIIVPIHTHTQPRRQIPKASGITREACRAACAGRTVVHAGGALAVLTVVVEFLGAGAVV